MITDLAGALRRAMEASSMSQADVARESGLTQPYINQILNGRRGSRPSHDTLARLERVLPGITASVLNGTTPSNGSPTTPTEAAI